MEERAIGVGGSGRGVRGRAVGIALALGLLAVPTLGDAQSGEGEEGDQPQQVTVTPPRLNLRRQDVDLTNRKVAYSISRVAVRSVIEIRGMQRDLMYSQENELGSARAGTRLEVTWPEQTSPIALIEVTTFDENEASVTFKIWPFRVEIPHVDVVFETNKWEIRDSEKAKLDEAWVLIEQAFRDYGDWIEAGLFIAGFTDTVGQPGDNNSLSEKRAQAIAEYFMAKGQSFPIHVRGYGERCLAQETGDSVDCEANRRAAYVLAVDPPVMCSSEGGGSWRRVR
jgi:outer membrane protein OmpA-like peptidoglycan-associated protein